MDQLRRFRDRIEDGAHPVELRRVNVTDGGRDEVKLVMYDLAHRGCLSSQVWSLLENRHPEPHISVQMSRLFTES